MVVSDYQRRFRVQFLYDWANGVTTFLTFLFSVSFGFAITNVAPCKNLDGDYISTTFLEQLGYAPDSRVTRVFLWVCTVFFVFSVALGFVPLVTS